MKKNLFYKTVILFVLVLIFSCSQDPIFFIISTETAPEKPLIPGGPTNMVEFVRNGVPVMYVASGSLYGYRDGAWNSAESIPQPGGTVRGLAATKGHLYALCFFGSGVNTVLRRIGPYDGEWTTITIADGTYTALQTIYADPGSNRLFAGAIASDNIRENYGILYLDDTTSTLMLLQSDTALLSGAAGDSGGNHYLSTRGKGVLKVSETDLAVNTPFVEPLREGTFMGMIKLNDPGNTIIVVARDGGELFEVQPSELVSKGVSTGSFATGALAVWQNVNNPAEQMLTAGIQERLYSSGTTSSSYKNGYVEFPLYNDGSIGSPNDPPSITVDGNEDRYTAGIGKHPINHMHQASPDVDSGRRFFASTQSAGLWSYRDRSGGPQWNAEN